MPGLEACESNLPPACSAVHAGVKKRPGFCKLAGMFDYAPAIDGTGDGS